MIRCQCTTNVLAHDFSDHVGSFSLLLFMEDVHRKEISTGGLSLVYRRRHCVIVGAMSGSPITICTQFERTTQWFQLSHIRYKWFAVTIHPKTYIYTQLTNGKKYYSRHLLLPKGYKLGAISYYRKCNCCYSFCKIKWKQQSETVQVSASIRLR